MLRVRLGNEIENWRHLLVRDVKLLDALNLALQLDKAAADKRALGRDEDCDPNAGLERQPIGERNGRPAQASCTAGIRSKKSRAFTT